MHARYNADVVRADPTFILAGPKSLYTDIFFYELCTLVFPDGSMVAFPS